MAPVEHPTAGDGVTRREFLRVGGLGVVGLSLAEQTGLARTAFTGHRRAIFILMAGGPSQLETFDPKPDAPSSIRGPFKAISTRVPGVFLSESLPMLAQRLDRCALIRSLCHDWAPIHETGQQLLQTGRVMQDGVRFPHFGSVIAQALSGAAGATGGSFGPPVSSRPPNTLSSTGRALASEDARQWHPTQLQPVPSNVILPRILRDTGVHSEHGQSGGLLGDEWSPAELSLDLGDEPEPVRRAYGDSHFGRLLLSARQLIEQGTHCVTVNLFDALHQQLTWDCHGDANCAPGTLYDYRDTLCPQFDRALSALLDDLEHRGLLDDTLVVATGEFGRTPRINDRAGRDHWPGCWSALIAGGKLTGGAVLGASDSTASQPLCDPISPAQIPATLLAWFGIDGQALTANVDDRTVPLIPAAPLKALWPA
jgi:hypothetical protein